MRPSAHQSKKAGWLGAIAGFLSGSFRRGKLPVRQKDIQTLDFPTSSQKMGLTFSEKVREVFRFRWIRKR
jgi:hypothetical protein